MKKGRLLGAAVLIVIALAVAWTPLQEANDRAYRSAVDQAQEELRPILAELPYIGGQPEDLDQIERAGVRLRELAGRWQERIESMPVSKELEPAKASMMDTLANLEGSGDAYARFAEQERAGQETEAADSWNFAEEYRMKAQESLPHAQAAATQRQDA